MDNSESTTTDSVATKSPSLTDSGAESGRKLPSSRYKGVVPQPNGRWGAQIYEKHHRVWLGTFDTEAAAAGAYDVAAVRFRGRDAATNLARKAASDEAEAAFLCSRSKTEVVDMLRKHTYADELAQSRRHFRAACSAAGDGGGEQGSPPPIQRVTEPLFEKTVTPSDVGKLNRLVIPKQHAEKHFPLAGGSASASSGLLLNFKDSSGKVWRFRYSYWNSSQSYVLTKGWSRFVKEKQLLAGDVVGFHKSTGQDNQLFIESKAQVQKVQVVVQPVQMVRLFGVNIFDVPVSGVKRSREMELLEMECYKKPRAIGAL